MNKKVIKSIMIVLVLIVVGLYLFFENNTLEITKYDIDSNKITDEFNGYKIAQISDYHNSKSSMLKKSIIESLNAPKEYYDVFNIYNTIFSIIAINKYYYRRKL